MIFNGEAEPGEAQTRELNIMSPKFGGTRFVASSRIRGHDKAWPSTAARFAASAWRDALHRRVPCSCGCWHEHVFPVGGRDMLTQTAA